MDASKDQGTKSANTAHEVVAVAHLYQRYRAQARRTARRFYPTDAAAVEDVVQDVFVSLCEVYERIDTTKCLAGWVGRVAANRCLSKKRRESVAANWQQSAEAITSAHSRAPGGDLESQIAERDDLAHVLGSLERLPQKQAYAFRKYCFGGVEQAEIAQDLGVSKGYVSRLIKTARIALRQEISEDELMAA